MTDPNRSLLRGIEILNAFKPGLDLLGNADIAERTQLPKSTVSRLTQTLVGSGMLEHDPQQRAYRLAAPVLSLAFAMKSSSPVLSLAAPHMQLYAEKYKVNIGLAVADRDEMMYIESLRYNHKLVFRNVVAGLRVPMELTSLGRAWLATVSDAKRQELFGIFKTRRPKDWEHIEQEIDLARQEIRNFDHCHATWQPGVLALSTPLKIANFSMHILNISIGNSENTIEQRNKLSCHLLELKKEISS